MKRTILIISLVLFVLAVGFSTAAAAAPAQEKQNMEVVKKVFAVFKTKDTDSLNHLMGNDLPGKATGTFKMWWEQYSEVNVEIDDIFASGDKVAVRWTFNGIKNRITGQNQQSDFISHFQLANGKIIEMWSAEGPSSQKSIVVLQSGKQRTTMIHMKTASNAIRHYKFDHGKAPEAKNFAELQSLLSPRYIKTLPLKDGWGNDFHYSHGTGEKKNEYTIGSGGMDGVFEGWDQSGFYIVTTLSGFNNDFILANDRFVYSPKTKPSNTKPPVPKTFEDRLRFTMADVHVVGRAITVYMEDYHQVPKVNSIHELKKILQPFYIKTLPLADAWNNELLYKIDPKNPKNYWVASPGSDGKFRGFDQKGTWKVEEGEKGQDIVLFNGDFTYMPDVEKR